MEKVMSNKSTLRSEIDMDSALIPKGAKRCPFPVFAAGMAVVGVVLLWGVYAMGLCWFKGLNQTNMNDYYGFAPLDMGRPCRDRHRRRAHSLRVS